jgi:hypothetical protein
MSAATDKFESDIFLCGYDLYFIRDIIESKIW